MHRTTHRVVPRPRLASAGLDSLGIAQATAEPMSYFGPNDAGLPFVENMLKFDIASFGQPQ